MQYSYTISIGDGEMIALRDAVEQYKKFVFDKIEDRIEAPYWARLKNIKEMMERLNSSVQPKHNISNINLKIEKL
jgi:uncharacterized protein YllA (UPF0747 family)